MPIYEFKCKACNTVFERLCLKGDDTRKAACPKCGHPDAERMMSAFSSFSTGNGFAAGDTGSIQGGCSSRGFS